MPLGEPCVIQLTSTPWTCSMVASGRRWCYRWATSEIQASSKDEQMRRLRARAVEAGQHRRVAVLESVRRLSEGMRILLYNGKRQRVVEDWLSAGRLLSRLESAWTVHRTGVEAKWSGRLKGSGVTASLGVQALSRHGRSTRPHSAGQPAGKDGAF